MWKRAAGLPYDVLVGAVVLVLLGFLFGAVVGGRTPNEQPSHGPKYADQHEDGGNADSSTLDYNALNLDLAKQNLSLSESDLRAQWAMAIGTFALFALTLVAIGVSIWATVDARRASDKALEETKRSVDMYLERERGRISYRLATRHEGKLPKKVGFTFTNTGPTQLTIAGFGHFFQACRDEGSAEPAIDIPYDALDEKLNTGEAFTTSATLKEVMTSSKDPRQDLLEVPQDVLDALAGNDNWNLTLTFAFIYQTDFGPFVKHHTIQFFNTSDVHTLFRRDLTYDMRHSEWLTFLDELRKERDRKLAGYKMERAEQEAMRQQRR